MFYTRQSDGLTYCFSPVPLLAESKEFLRVPNDSSSLATITTLTFNGTLLPDVPALTGISPDATCLELLDRKSDQLAFALSEDRGSLVIVDASGYTVVNARPKVVSLDFEESQIVNHRKYTIVFEIESDFGNNRVREFEETWSFNQNEDDTVAVSHEINAVGIHDAAAGFTAITNARSYVLNRANTINKDQSVFIKQPYVSALVDVDQLTQFNHLRSENSNLVAGSFGISETWIMASGSFKDDRTIDQSWELNDAGALIQTLTIQGTVQGYGDTTFDKYNAAQNGFDTFVAPQIQFYSASGITSRSLSRNRFGGSVNYSLNIIPTGSADDQIETRGLTRSFERNEDGSVTQTVTTSAQLRKGSPSGISALVDLVWSSNYPIDSFEPPFSAALSGNIESISVQRDELQKSISLTRVYRDQSTLNWREEWEVSRNQQVDTSIVSVSIQGTVFGLVLESGTKTEVRFNAASGAYFGIVKPLARTRVLPIIPTGYCVGQNPTSTTLGFNRQNGVITYSENYDTRYATSNASIKDEQVDVSFVNSADVVAEIGIPGKADGPILQDQETITGLQKSVRIQYTMAPSGDTCTPNTTINNLLLAVALTESNVLINNTPSQNSRGEKPESSLRVFKTEDQYSWNRQTLVFQRSVSWKYK